MGMAVEDLTQLERGVDVEVCNDLVKQLYDLDVDMSNRTNLCRR